MPADNFVSYGNRGVPRSMVCNQKVAVREECEPEGRHMRRERDDRRQRILARIPDVLLGIKIDIMHTISVAGWPAVLFCLSTDFNTINLVGRKRITEPVAPHFGCPEGVREPRMKRQE